MLTKLLLKPPLWRQTTMCHEDMIHWPGCAHSCLWTLQQFKITTQKKTPENKHRRNTHQCSNKYWFEKHYYMNCFEDRELVLEKDHLVKNDLDYWTHPTQSSSIEKYSCSEGRTYTVTGRHKLSNTRRRLDF